MKEVIKRDGRRVPFDKKKIKNAIGKAIESATGEFDEKLADIYTTKVCRKLISEVLPIESIQNVVEQVLVEARDTSTAKAYMLYRERHKNFRENKSLIIDIAATMDDYLEKEDWRVKENSNISYSLGGLILHNSGKVVANYWLSKVYTKEIAEAHRTCAFHIHDLSMFAPYCAGWSLRQLIQEGLGGVPDKVSSTPARHLSTLTNQMVNFFGILQNEWAGAQAFSSFDTYLAPFVKIDNLTEKEVRQCLQSFVYGVNTPSRWGSQAPFTNITLDWTVPNDLKDNYCLIGGETVDFTYGDCQKEMDLINKVFIDLMMEGDAVGRGFQYPIPTYNITKDFEWDTPNAQRLFEMTAKYGTPYFQNFVNSDMNPSDVRSMCCRLQLDKRELRKRGGGLFGSDEFTGSIGVVTINLPQLAYLSKDKGEDEFYKRLDRLMVLAKDSLEQKRKVITHLLDDDLFPYTKRYLPSLNNHFATIGICGMNEACLNFLGCDLLNDEGHNFALNVLKYMRTRLADFQEETGNLYNLEATPAESTSYRLALHDKQNFPNIITSGTHSPYYTNSSQLPVNADLDVFDALDKQDDLQRLYTGGTVFHVLLGEKAMINVPGVKNLVKTIAYNYKLPYFSISPTFSVCPVHGYLAGEHFECPKCKAEKVAELTKQLNALKEERRRLS